MVETWLSTSWTETGLVVLSAVVIFAAVIAVARVAGLRTFSKMSSFDFAITVATGTIVASVSITSTSLANGLVALVVLYLCQWGVALARRHTSVGSEVVDNKPLLLMLDGQVLEENLDVSRVTREDLMAKLREANALRLEDVRAVVLETTGDVSVLHGDGPVDPELLSGVRDGPGRRRPGLGA